eukprot:3698659-Pleurochrysis_carterae.AAC.1
MAPPPCPAPTPSRASSANLASATRRCARIAATWFAVEAVRHTSVLSRQFSMMVLRQEAQKL